MLDSATQKCWICGNNPANSREHIIKKSTLKFVFGKIIKGLSKIIGDKKTSVQGIDSKLLKYSNSICDTCNNNFTSPYDKAYDTLICYINNNINTLAHNQSTQISNIFSNDDSVRNCYRYFVKCFGCALCEAGREIPNDLVQCVRGETYPCQLGLRFALHSNCLGDREDLTSHNQAVVYDLDVFENDINQVSQFGMEIGALQILMFHTPNNSDENLWYGNSDHLNIRP